MDFLERASPERFGHWLIFPWVAAGSRAARALGTWFLFFLFGVCQLLTNVLRRLAFI